MWLVEFGMFLMKCQPELKAPRTRLTSNAAFTAADHYDARKGGILVFLLRMRSAGLNELMVFRGNRLGRCG